MPAYCISCLPTVMVLQDFEKFVPAYCNGALGLRKIRACLLLWCFGTLKNSCMLTIMVLRDLEKFVPAYCNGAFGLRNLHSCLPTIMALSDFRVMHQ